MFAVIAFFVAVIWTGAWTAESIYSNTTYGAISPSLLSSMQARIKPYAVANAQVSSSLNSSSENPDNLGIGIVNGKITWTAINDPNGTFRSYTTARTASSRSRGNHPNLMLWLVRQKRTVFSSTAPVLNSAKTLVGTRIRSVTPATSPSRWRAQRSRRNADRPLLKWRAAVLREAPLFFDGVFVEHAGGPMLKLTVAQAEADPELVAFGHIFPAGLALRIAQAYEYKNGIAQPLDRQRQLEVATIGEEETNSPTLRISSTSDRSG